MNWPVYLAINLSSNVVYASEFNTNLVRQLNLNTGIINTAYTLAGGAHGLAISPDNSYLLATTWTGDRVVKLAPGQAAVNVAGGGTLTTNGVAATSTLLNTPAMVRRMLQLLSRHCCKCAPFSCVP